MKKYFITCYADFLGYSIALFSSDNNGLTLVKLIYSDLVSNKNIQEALNGLNNYFRENKIRQSEVGLYLNENKILRKYLKENIYSFRTIQTLEFELEETLYILSIAINDETFSITKEVAKHNIVREIKNLDLQTVNHKIYSLLLAVTKLQKSRDLVFICLTTGKTFKPNTVGYRNKYPFGKPNVREIKDLFR